MGILKALLKYALVTVLVIFAGTKLGVIQVDFDLDRATELKNQAVSATVDGYNKVLGNEDATPEIK